MGDPTPPDFKRTPEPPSMTVESVKKGLILPKRFSEVKDSGIRQQDIDRLREWIRQYDPQLKLFNKLLANVRCIDDQQLNTATQKMEQAIDDFVGLGPYYVLIDGFGHGGGYIYNRMHLRKLPQSVLARQEIPEYSRQSLAIQSSDKVVFVDDASYQAGQISVILKDLISNSHVTPDNILVALAGVTDQALNHQFSELRIPNLIATYYIPQVREIFTPQEREVIKEFSFSWVGNTEYSVLTYFRTHKVPDNFIGSLRRSIGGNQNPYLVDDTKDGIYPPYRR